MAWLLQEQVVKSVMGNDFPLFQALVQSGDRSLGAFKDKLMVLPSNTRDSVLSSLSQKCPPADRNAWNVWVAQIRAEAELGSGKQQAAQQAHGQHSLNYPAQAPAQQVMKPPEGRRRSMAEAIGDITIGYWHIRGLGAPIRMMLTYFNTPFANELHSKAHDGGKVTGPGDWPKIKEERTKTENGFMNLPYLKCNYGTLTQSTAILNFLGDLFGIQGSNAWERALCQNVMLQAIDVRAAVIRVWYQPAQDRYEKAREQFVKSGAAEQLSKVETWLQQRGSTFMVANTPLVCDFLMWEVLDQHVTFYPECFKDFPLLAAYHKRFRSLPQLQPYFQSNMSRWPINNLDAMWDARLPEDAVCA